MNVHKMNSSNIERDFKCICCGYTNHTVKFCRFRSYNCKTFGKKGHLASVCNESSSYRNLQKRDQVQENSGNAKVNKGRQANVTSENIK